MSVKYFLFYSYPFYPSEKHHGINCSRLSLVIYFLVRFQCEPVKSNISPKIQSSIQFYVKLRINKTTHTQHSPFLAVCSILADLNKFLFVFLSNKSQIFNRNVSCKLHDWRGSWIILNEFKAAKCIVISANCFNISGLQRLFLLAKMYLMMLPRLYFILFLFLIDAK